MLDTDLVAASIIYARTGMRQESWTVKPNRAHRWYYKHNQQRDEVILIKCFDSVEDPGKVAARRAPHCAVEYPGEGEEREGRRRESVEVRCLVFY